MKILEKVSEWLLAVGLAIAVLFAFTYLDIIVITCFRLAGVNTAIYRGIVSLTAALVVTLVFGLFFFVCRKLKRPLLQVKKISAVDVGLVIIIAVGMLGFVKTFIYVSDQISEYIKSLSEQMTEYRESVDRYSVTKQEIVPFWDSLIYLFSLCFIVPIEEELVFRGAIFGLLRKKMSPVAAMLVSAAIFGVMHRVSIHTAYALVCGLILCACYHYTESLIASMIIHSVFNILGSGVGDLLKLNELGVPSDLRLEILSRISVISILMMIPSGIAFLVLRYNSIKRKKTDSESVIAVE